MGFSLVEVVIALGIVSFAVVAVIGMLPVALKSCKDSMVETDATLIAKRIFSELKAGSGANRPVSANSSEAALINLAAEGTNHVLAFAQDGTVRSYSTSDSSNATFDYFARISVSTNTGTANLSRVQVDITAPAAAPPSARTTNSFVTFIGY